MVYSNTRTMPCRPKGFRVTDASLEAQSIAIWTSTLPSSTSKGESDLDALSSLLNGIMSSKRGLLGLWARMKHCRATN